MYEGLIVNIKSQFSAYSTQQLLSIWKEKDQPNTNYTEEAFEAVRQLLIERGILLKEEDNNQTSKNEPKKQATPKKIRTHYDNLKVARDAPIEIIKAAYRILSQKYHPDKYTGDAKAEQIMAIINTSYEALSDADKRREHDLWIAQQEALIAQTSNENNQHYSTSPPRQATPAQQQPSNPVSDSGGIIVHILRNWVLYSVAGFFIWIWATDKPITPPSGPKPYQATPIPPRPAYVRPHAAPNGQPWPNTAGYVGGYQRLHTDGLSTVTVDNSRNDSDVFVKLVSLDGAQAHPVRHFYIPAFGSFTINTVEAGSYDIRYRDLSNGGLSRSEVFNLEETPTYNGTKYSNITMTLYKVQNGNLHTYGLSETEF